MFASAFRLVVLHVEADQSCQRECQALGKFCIEFDIIQQAGKHADLPLGNGVQRDGKQTVHGKGIFKAFHDRICEESLFLIGQVNGAVDFLFDGLPDEFSEDRIFHHFVDVSQAAETCSENVSGVCAVEETDFSCTVRGLIIGNDNIEPGSLKGKFLFNGFRSFDDEEMEDFAAVDKFIFIAELFFHFSGFIAGITGNDAVDKCVKEGVFRFDPVFELFGEVPEIGILEDAVLEIGSVFVDEFAGEEVQTFFTGCKTFIKKTCDFCRIGVLALTGGVRFFFEFDSGFGGVGEDEPDIFTAESADGFEPLMIGVQAAFDTFDDFFIFHDFAVFDTAEDKGVKTFLSVDHIAHSLFEGLNDLDHSVEFSLFVHGVDHPVDECAEEVTFAELNDFYGHVNGFCSFEQAHFGYPFYYFCISRTFVVLYLPTLAFSSKNRERKNIFSMFLLKKLKKCVSAEKSFCFSLDNYLFQSYNITGITDFLYILLKNKKQERSSLMNLKSSLAALAAGLFLTAGASDAYFDTPPSVTVPKLKTFKIDGKISPEEERYTAGMNGFSEVLGRIAMLPIFDADARFQVGTDGKNLYIATECETAPSGILQRMRKGRNGNVFADDTHEFVFTPNPGAKVPDLYHVILNNKGAYSATAKKNGSNCGWEPKFTAKGTLANGKWTYEIAFPLDQFGIKGWKDGTTIGLRICRNWRGISFSPQWAIQSSWSQVKCAFFDTFKIPTLTMKQDTPVVRFLDITKDQKPNLQVSFYNPSSKTVTINTHYVHKPVNSQSINEKKSYTLKAGETRQIQLPTAQVADGETVQAAYKVTDAKGNNIYFRSFLWKKEKREIFKALSAAERIAAKFAFYPSTNNIYLQIDASAMGKEIFGLGKFTAEVKDKSGKSIAKATLPAFNKEFALDYLFQLPDLKAYTRTKNPSGEYELIITGGKSTQKFKFERKLFDWEGNKIGKSDILIPGFTAMKVDEGGFFSGDPAVYTVLRKHTLSSAGFWKQVNAAGEDLFVDGGIKLIAKIGGKEYVAKGKGVKFTKKSDTVVNAVAEWTAGPLKGKTVIHFEFDGMMKFDLVMNPGVKVDSLKMIVPMDAEKAYLFHESGDGLRFNYAGKTPDSWKSSDAAKRNILTSYIPYIWLGKEGPGFCVYGDNDRGWSIDKNVPAQTITRRGEKIELVMNLFAKPVNLKEPRKITMAFQATPVKPMPKNWRRRQASWGFPTQFYKYVDYAIRFYGSSLCQGGVCGSDDLFPRNRDHSLWEMYGQIRRTGVIPKGFLEKWLAGYPKNSPRTMDVYRREINFGLHNARWSRKPSTTTNDLGQKTDLSVTFYTNARGQRIDIPESRTFLDDWFREDFQESRKTPPSYGASKAYSVTPVETYRDFAITRYKKMIETGACDNIYWDDMFLGANENYGGSTDAYILEDGRLQPSFGVFDLRELTKRTAIMQVELGRVPNNMVHMTNAAMVPICAFVQQNLDWEDNLGSNPFQQRYSKEYLRATTIARQFGNLPAALGLLSGDKKVLEFCTETGAGVAITHEIQWTLGSPRSKDFRHMLESFYKFGYGQDDKVQVLNYWDKNYPVKITGAENSSILLRKGKEFYLVVCNYGEAATLTAEITDIGAFTAIDGNTNKPVNVSGNKVTFKLGKYGYIFLKGKVTK